MFSDPNTIIPQLAIPLGATVADLGAGTGSYAIPLAKKVGPTGKVYACELQKDMITRLENELRGSGIKNVQSVWANIEAPMGTKLRDQTIDWVIAANILFQVEDKSGFATEIARIVKPNGSVLVIDWRESFGNLGPHEREVVSEAKAIELFATVGLKKSPQIVEAGAHHYGVVFKKQV